jgi:hypothetical protein
VVHACNPSYSGDGDQEVRGKKASWGQDAIPTNKPGMVMHAYDPRYMKGIGGRIMIPGWLRQKVRPCLKNILKAKGLRVWLKWQSACIARPWLKPQYCCHSHFQKRLHKLYFGIKKKKSLLGLAIFSTITLLQCWSATVSLALARQLGRQTTNLLQCRRYYY